MSDVGFVDFWIVMVLLGYSLAVFSFRAGLGPKWQRRDPLSVLFSLAGRLAPLRLRGDGLVAKSPVAELAPGGSDAAGLFRLRVRTSKNANLIWPHLRRQMIV